MFSLEPVRPRQLKNDAYLALLDLKRATAERLARSTALPPVTSYTSIRSRWRACAGTRFDGRYGQRLGGGRCGADAGL
ncbi:hypothetical protein [Streptomyces sp. V1I6]|uniref:hypothetical protein n=1 Tax=Streptomyces sp. V1I6 TaxID=3042273 RepID=UPI0027D8862A|nr:hypothetical protein [Streptomyces sp. V1I6]